MTRIIAVGAHSRMPEAGSGRRLDGDLAPRGAEIALSQ